MKTILDLSDVKAYRYFMESENYCNFCFPVYISFMKILKYVESTVGNNTNGQSIFVLLVGENSDQQS